MSETPLDALIIGTGLAGIYSLHTLLQQNLTVKALEKAPSVGGTWYWNRYPGALSDTWSHMYRYSFDDELLQTYPWPRWYVTQPEILAYLDHVVDRYDLRKYMQFETEMSGAKWDDEAGLWRVDCVSGEVFYARYLVTALGVLHKPNVPNIPGIESFRGQIAHTSAWDPAVDVGGKRVGVVGVGSSGVQVVTAIAGKVESLHVFIRRPHYSVPSGNRPVTAEDRDAINKQYPELWREARSSALGFGFPEPTRKTMSVSPEDREAILEDLWQRGNGMQFMFGGFADVVTDEAANEEVCRFLRKKIAAIVTDPQKRAILTPKELFARRPLCDDGYYEQFNRENVFAVDALKNPITEITPTGMRTADGTVHELDIIIFATGFDALDGSYANVNIQGRDGTNLASRWESLGPTSFVGVSVPGFPNLLMLNGPASGFTNVPPLTETNVEFVRDLISRAEEIRQQTGGRRCEIEATAKAEEHWTRICRASGEMTLFSKVPSWLFGENIPGKARNGKFFMGGLVRFRAMLADIQARGYEGFKGPFGASEEEPAARL